VYRKSTHPNCPATRPRSGPPGHAATAYGLPVPRLRTRLWTADLLARAWAGARLAAACALLIAPAAAAAAAWRPALRLTAHLADERPPAEGGAAPSAPDLSPPEAAPPSPGALEFDLLGPPPTAPAVEGGRGRARRRMLSFHQASGIGLLGLQLATTVVGQLNYNDRFSGQNTGRYRSGHKLLAYSTLGAFAVTGLAALFAPSPPPTASRGFDRVDLHRLAMATAAAGMVAQGLLGVATREREGYLDQRRMAQTHLVIGYVTLAAVLVGVGALVW
jgi:hypothetical protein